MVKLVNRAKMTTATTGTGTLTLASAVAGCLAFAAAGVANADTVRYTIEDGSNFEIGFGVYSTTGTTLTRNLILSSTGALLNLSGSAVVFVTATAEDFQTLLAGDGSASAPSHSFDSSPNMGMFKVSSTALGWSVGGNHRMALSDQGALTLYSDVGFYPIVSFENFAAASGSGPIFRGQKRRGAGAAQSGDTAFLVAGQGHDGTTYFDMGNIRFAIDGTVSTNIVPGRISFTTTDAAGAQQERLRINSAGAWGIGPALDYGLPGEVLSAGNGSGVPVKWEYPGKPATLSAAGASITTTSTVIIGITLEAGEVVAGSEYEFEAYLSIINTATATNFVPTLGQNATVIHSDTVALGTTANASPGRSVLVRGRITFYSTTSAVASLWVKTTGNAVFDRFTAITTAVTVSTAAGNVIYLGGSVSGATSSIIPRSAMARKVK